MRYLLLGGTDLEVSEVGFGCIPIIRLQTGEAVRVLKHAFEKGINFFDTANMYRDSEDKVGRALSDVRHRVVLATKTTRRDAAGLREHLENSLRMLRTDYIDLYQFHQVAGEKDWEQICRPGGALEAAQAAKEQGKIRFLGVTSHIQDMAVKIIKTGLFSTVQFPFNLIETDAEDELHRLAREMGLGIIAMKSFAGGVIDSAGVAFKYLRQFPDVIPIPGFDSTEAVDQVVSIYEQPNELRDEDLAAMDGYRAELGRQFCRRCEYCQPCPNGVMITSAMGYKIVASRMSPAVSTQFSKQVMETVPACVDCGECVSRCPYELPIPEMLKKNYNLYQEHLQQLG